MAGVCYAGWPARPRSRRTVADEAVDVVYAGLVEDLDELVGDGGGHGGLPFWGQMSQVSANRREAAIVGLPAASLTDCATV